MARISESNPVNEHGEILSNYSNVPESLRVAARLRDTVIAVDGRVTTEKIAESVRAFYQETFEIACERSDLLGNPENGEGFLGVEYIERGIEGRMQKLDDELALMDRLVQLARTSSKAMYSTTNHVGPKFHEYLLENEYVPLYIDAHRQGLYLVRHIRRELEKLLIPEEILTAYKAKAHGIGIVTCNFLSTLALLKAPKNIQDTIGFAEKFLHETIEKHLLLKHTGKAYVIRTTSHSTNIHATTHPFASAQERLHTDREMNPLNGEYQQMQADHLLQVELLDLLRFIKIALEKLATSVSSRKVDVSKGKQLLLTES